jgi:flagellar hook-basal body complex protein FliE
MKRIGLFSVILLGTIAGFYMQPVFFPPKAEEKQPTEQQLEEKQRTAWKYQEMKATGFSTYINHSIDDLEKEFGKASDKADSGFGFETRYYHDVSGDYFEVNVEDGKVTAVKVLKGNNQMIKPFSFGMTMQDLTAYTTIYTNFTFDYHGEEVGLELMEEDMNYRPLVAFDNDTFAILFFDQTSGELFATVYLNKESLLKLLPYQVFGRNLPVYKFDTAADWTAINQKKMEKSITLLNFLRRRDHLPMYETSEELQRTASSVLSNFLTAPEETLNDDRMADWEKASQSISTAREFNLTNNEMQDLLKNNEVSDAEGLFSHPIIDPGFSFLFWYSDPFNHDRFMTENQDFLSIAFSKENVLVLMKEDQTKGSDSSDYQ